ncbi:hypothetical protein FEM48_Zijuj09G0183800 [Ziziphus jujuba var. spinosa]|uniref:Pentatricopeptide repeat-containing protein n=1 Tax=Ziziphus jujuba var. spinosa TaxID=714518 RepID=A0A978UUK3_ZIZJJ|nr:hypothetical protein FEM48_Zijuj09G0183800 [Ziziphus jujuba var. spinosa]
MKTAKFTIPLQQSKQVLYSSISEALTSASNSKQLHKVHSLIVTLGLEHSVFLSGKLISKYAKFKDPISSLSVFRGVLPTNNVYQWNSIIRALTHNGMYSDALHHYAEMQKMKVQPDTYTFPSVINACALLQDFEMGRIVHEGSKISKSICKIWILPLTESAVFVVLSLFGSMLRTYSERVWGEAKSLKLKQQVAFGFFLRMEIPDQTIEEKQA